MPFSSSFRATGSGSPDSSADIASPALEQLEPLVVEGRVRVGVEIAELLAVAVLVQQREPRLRRAERQLLAPERRSAPRARRSRARPRARRARRRRSRPRRPCAAGRAPRARPRTPPLGLPERLELISREEVGVAGDDLGLLGGLLLAHAHGAALLRALEQVLLQPLLVVERRVDPGCRHREEIYTPRQAQRGGQRVIIARVAASPGTSEARDYAGTMAGFWSGLSITLRRLDEIAADSRRLDADALERLRALQYGLHRSSEPLSGVEPPPGVRSGHEELAAALVDARDTTGDIAEAIDELRARRSRRAPARVARGAVQRPPGADAADRRADAPVQRRAGGRRTRRPSPRTFASSARSRSWRARPRALAALGSRARTRRRRHPRVPSLAKASGRTRPRCSDPSERLVAPEQLDALEQAG